MVFVPILIMQFKRHLTVLHERKERLSIRKVNTKHDTASYENCSYQREIFSPDNLYKAFLKSKQNSDWKQQVQKYEMNFLIEITRLYRELSDRSFKFSPTSEFKISERGKTRVITGEQIHDRIARGCLCENSLLPTIRNRLIYDNGASLKGKGIQFSRDRLDVHLRKFFRQNGSNDGYILLIDFTKYYDNIRHKELIEIFEKSGIDSQSMWFLQLAINKARVDVSYLTDAEYASCLDAVFNSIEYRKLDRVLLSGEKYMDKHLSIGDQIAQVAGISYPIRFDNYIKIVKGVKFYARYMDDSYIIHHDKDYLHGLLAELIEVASKIGITINTRKTRICKLSSMWRFLQIQYSLTDTGRIVKKINPKRLTAMRRKLKKLSFVINQDEFDNLYGSWFNGYFKIMSKQQRKNMNELHERTRTNNVQNHTS